MNARAGNRAGIPAFALLCAWTLAVLFVATGCSRAPEAPKETVLFTHGLDGFDGIVDVSSVQIDPMDAAEGGGSARIEVSGDATVNLFEVPDPDVEAAVLVYRAKLRARNVGGQAYIQMLCRFPGKGEFFSKGLPTAVKGTTGWSSAEAPFFLKKGENPDLVRLTLVIEGGGTVWVDDVQLVVSPR